VAAAVAAAAVAAVAAVVVFAALAAFVAVASASSVPPALRLALFSSLWAVVLGAGALARRRLRRSRWR